MGPMAGVLLQKLIIENTPALKDQDHIKVVCFTNPHIPDRTKSLQEDGGKKFVAAITDSIKILEKAGVNCILMPCNTSHACFDNIQNATHIPILNMIEIALDKIRELGASCVGLLSTDGVISSRVFNADKNLKIILPDIDDQQKIMDAIYEIKSGKYNDSRILSEINAFIKKLEQKGAEKIILGCTELSIYSPFIKKENIVDPLVELSKEAVKMATAV